MFVGSRKGMQLLTAFVGFLVIGYIVLLVTKAKPINKEPFTAEPSLLYSRDFTNFNDSILTDVTDTQAVLMSQGPATKERSPVIMEQHLEAPYVQESINSVDDYEHNLIYQNENDKEMSQDLKNRLTARYPLDWTVQPPSSTVFQQGLNQYNNGQYDDYAEKREKEELIRRLVKEEDKEAEYAKYQKQQDQKTLDRLQKRIEGFEDQKPASKPTTLNPYKEIEQSSLNPPDTTALEQEERKIIQTYHPAKADSLTTYDIDDAKTLIHKIYDAKGLIPTVVEKPNNVYEVVGTRRKDEKIVYEDSEAPAGNGPTAVAGEATINVPPSATDVAVGLDPFFTTEPSSRDGRWNYTKFTPGLERMFAPTFPQNNWH